MLPLNQVEGRGGPVTVTVSRRVKPGQEAKYEAWLHGLSSAAMQFEGHLGVTILRTRGQQEPEYLIIFRFDTPENLKRWGESDVRRSWLEQVGDMTLGESNIHVTTGLESWFTLPGWPNVPPPPRYKMAIVTLLAVFPLSLGVGAAVESWLGGVHFALRGLVIATVLVLLLTYVVMPLLTRLFARWLFDHVPAVTAGAQQAADEIATTYVRPHDPHEKAS